MVAFSILSTDRQMQFVRVQQSYMSSDYDPASFTFNTQPLLGLVLFSGTIGDGSSAKYWTVLGTDGVNTLLAGYRATGITNGIEIKGGTVDPVGIYSSRATQNQPRMSMNVRF